MEVNNKHLKIINLLNVFTVLFFSGFIVYWIHKLALSVQNHSPFQLLISIGMILFNGYMMRSTHTSYKTIVNQSNE